MKKLTVLLILISPLLTRAQEDVYQKIAQETCDCISKKDINVLSKNEVTAALGICMIETAQGNGMDLNLSDHAAMRSLGEQIGIKMAPLCPKVFESFAVESAEEQDQVIEIEGTIKAVEQGDFAFITLKGENGKETKLLWLGYFKGSDAFTSDPSKLEGKKVVVKYKLTECYVPKARDYFPQKEILELEVK